MYFETTWSHTQNLSGVWVVLVPDLCAHQRVCVKLRIIMAMTCFDIHTQVPTGVSNKHM